MTAWSIFSTYNRKRQRSADQSLENIRVLQAYYSSIRLAASDEFLNLWVEDTSIAIKNDTQLICDAGEVRGTLPGILGALLLDCSNMLIAFSLTYSRLQFDCECVWDPAGGPAVERWCCSSHFLVKSR